MAYEFSSCSVPGEQKGLKYMERWKSGHFDPGMLSRGGDKLFTRTRQDMFGKFLWSYPTLKNIDHKEKCGHMTMVTGDFLPQSFFRQSVMCKVHTTLAYVVYVQNKQNGPACPLKRWPDIASCLFARHCII